MQTFGEMDTGHLGYPFRKLGVAYPFPPNVHFSQMPICPNAHFFRCPFVPNIHFFQQPICPTSPYISMPICPKCFFAICPVPMCPGAHLSQVPIRPKCPFTLNSPYLQMPIFHSAHHFPKSPFAPMPISPKCPFAQVPNSPGPKCLGPRICPGPIVHTV